MIDVVDRLHGPTHALTCFRIIGARFAKNEFELHAHKWASKLAADGVTKKQALVWLNKARTGIPGCF